MDEIELEGTLVLERLAEIGKLDDFLEAVDADDVARLMRLRRAKLDEPTIEMVVKKLQTANEAH